MIAVLSVEWQGIFSGILSIALLAGALFYVTLVVVSYFQGRSRVRPPFGLRDPARSCERLAVWLGVKGLAGVIRVIAPVFEMLSEASADVGEWFLSRRHETQ